MALLIAHNSKGTGGGSGGTENLQQVLDIGNTAANQSITMTGNSFIWVTNAASGSQGSVISPLAVATPKIVIRDSTAYGGQIELSGAPGVTNYVQTLPNASGVLAASVNGNAADAAGNIAVPGLGPVTLAAGAASYAVAAGSLINTLVATDASAITVSIGTTPGGNDIIDSYPSVGGVATMFISQYFKTATTLYFTGITGATIFKIYKQ